MLHLIYEQKGNYINANQKLNDFSNVNQEVKIAIAIENFFKNILTRNETWVLLMVSKQNTVVPVGRENLPS